MPAPTPPTPAQWQAEILAEVGDPNTSLTPAIATIWGIFADKALIRPDLQFLYTKRACIDRRLAEEQSAVDFENHNGLQAKESQLFSHLQEMRLATNTEIVRIEAIVRASAAPAFGALTTLAPTTPPDPNGPDANDSRYSGRAYPAILPPW